MSTCSDSASARKAYDISFKLKVINSTTTASKNSVAKKFGIHRRRVQEWCKQKSELEKLAKSKKRVRGGGRKVNYPDIEVKLISWFEERRGKGVRVTGNGLKREAHRLHKANGNQSFKGTNSWFQKFKKRHNLSFRRVTHVAQKSTEIIDARVDRFLQNVIRNRRIADYADRHMANMDETPVWLEMPGRTTLEHTGTNTISVTTAGQEK